MKRITCTALALTLLMAAAPAAQAREHPTKDIVTTAVDAGKFKTLAAALKAAGLVEALKGKGPFTVFAPTDDAFAKLPKETVASLLKPENRATLVRILKYHVVPGNKLAKDVLASKSLKTLAGPEVQVSQNKGGAFINKSKILKTDVTASNGVIHVLDTVLLPPAAEKGDAQQARAFIEQTVARGAALYNHGDEAACARLYQKAVGQLMAMTPEAVPAAVRTRLSRAMSEVAHDHDADRQAWALRRGLDDAYRLLPRRAMMMTTVVAGHGH